MRRIFTMLLIIGLVVNTRAQLTNAPVVRETKTNNAYIDKIQLTPSNTLIGVKVLGRRFIKLLGRDTHFSLSTYIEYSNPQTGQLEKLQIDGFADIYGNMITINDTYLTNDMVVLVFPPIPKEVKEINLIGEKTWLWHGINIIPRDDVDVKQLATTEEEIKAMITKSKDSNAGMYEQLAPTEFFPANYRLAFVQTNDSIFLIYVGSTNGVGTWKCGEVKAILRPTVSNSIYKADWFMGNKTVSSAVINFEGATMQVHTDMNNSDVVFVRMSESSNSKSNESSTHSEYSEKWSGTGFALKDGYILTNYHVVEDAKSINIYGIDEDFKNGIKATVEGCDKLNDLALLKVSGTIPQSFKSIPYGFKSNIADVGENVYVLGYPLTTTMGEEVKLTNGIISARTGFDGDVSQYQISAPVQPGNSGGPLIDYNGNVIGVVCAKHTAAENASYAVKVSQVRNLIESVSDLSIMNTTNTLQGKTLKDQVKAVNNYVYIIKCSK